jgi:hypothetical protein
MKHIKRFNENDEFSWDDVLKDQRSDGKWEDLEKDIVALAEKYEGKFGVDSYGVVDAMYQVLEGMYQKK